MQICNPILHAKGDTNSNIDHSSNLVYDYIASICRKEKEIIGKKIKESYDEYSFIIFSSSIRNYAVAILLRLVNKRIKNLVKI